MAYDLAWKRLGDAIEEIGLSVDDRDRSRGIYYVSKGKGKKGFFVVAGILATKKSRQNLFDRSHRRK